MQNSTQHMLAKALSGILHPLLMPIYLGLIYLFVKPFSLTVEVGYGLVYLAIISICCLILPVLIIIFLKSINVIKSTHLNTLNDRFVPLMCTYFSYLLGVFFLKRLGVPELLVSLLYGVSITIFIVAIISLFWKISAHTAGLGGALAIILILSIRYHMDLSPFAIGIVLLGGAVAWSRLLLKHHNLQQVLYGYMTGFSVVMFAYSI